MCSGQSRTDRSYPQPQLPIPSITPLISSLPPFNHYVKVIKGFAWDTYRMIAVLRLKGSLLP